MHSGKRIAYFGIGAAAVLGIFLLTLWFWESRSTDSGIVTTTERAPVAQDALSEAERLASHTVTNSQELAVGASAVGLQLSPRLRGNVEGVKRTSDREVTVAGWLADTEGDGRPQKVVVFVGGKRAAIMQTQGERDDVTKALGLQSGAVKNVAFQATINCRTGDQVLFAGLAFEGHYYIDLGARACP
jgi:hypothetical protein